MCDCQGEFNTGFSKANLGNTITQHKLMKSKFFSFLWTNFQITMFTSVRNNHSLIDQSIVSQNLIELLVDLDNSSFYISSFSSILPSCTIGLHIVWHMHTSTMYWWKDSCYRAKNAMTFWWTNATCLINMQHANATVWYCSYVSIYV